MSKPRYDWGAKDSGEIASSVFPERLRRLRERRRISRKVMSELVGVSKNMIGRYERGEVSPTLEVAVEIADFFEVSLDYISGRQNFI